ncbi:DNA topoisomerase [Gymnopilus junonius]|uniref:DNA topoisomerase n=1 Tax=Gymnopilus junonius TaxID=109634 RepID=A0A9P5TRP4_GYMJU|nr:DNA topoisomerase [Gymnopilus junonius]
MRVLCVAEKPSISKSITQILSGGQYTTHNTQNKFIKNYEFDYPQSRSMFVVTAVVGHLTANDFFETHRSWHSCDAFELFDAAVDTQIPRDLKSIEQNLMTQARRSDMLMIWTDCDREGEHIGMEIARVCRKAKAAIQVKRARFSAIIAQQIHNAAQHPVELDLRQVDAVEARILLDLKIGAAFTRLQTLTLQGVLPQAERDSKGVISYGPCQFPTLGFVVQRYKLVKDFRPESFWYIYLSLTRQNASQENEETKFNWKRNHLFDQVVVQNLFEMMGNSLAIVTKVTNKTTKKWKPLPLTTVELQKAGSRLLKLAPKKVLDTAEKLYQQGFVSYPRTETDEFDPQFDHMSLIDKQTADPAWGQFATSLQNGGYSSPRKGKHNDKAHPPIHPTAHANNLNGDEKRVYEYITRRYLACCSKDAEGWQTTVDVECGGEEFSATGLIVKEKNYLNVYIYEKWNGHYVPDFQEGEEFEPTTCEIREGQTSKPNYLTEADLVTLMDKNGIGTDATIAQHIDTIVDRSYVIERFEGATKYLVPSTLGLGLIEGYNRIGLVKNVSKPQLRRETERRMVQVCEGTATKNDMLAHSLDQYKEMFILVRREFQKVTETVLRYVNGRGGAGGENGAGGNGGGGGGGGNGGGGDGGNNGGGGGRGRGNARGRPAARGTRGSAASGRGRGRGGAPNPASIIDVDDNDDGPDSDDDFNPYTAPAQRKTASSSRSTQAATSHTANAAASSSSSRLALPAPVHVSSNWQATVVAPTFASTSTSTSALSSAAATSWSRDTSVDNNTVKCECGIHAAEKTVTRETTSKGKKFWTCLKGACSFFQWMEDAPPGGVGWGRTSTSIPAKRSYSSTRDAPSTGDGLQRMCKCNEEAVQYTVQKEGANKGRLFWKCRKGENGSCGFFEWDDQPPQNVGGSSGSGMGRASGTVMSSRAQSMNVAGGSGSGSATDVCFKCNQTGHWASACPNGEGSSNKRSKSFGTNVNVQPDAECFKCHQLGHYSSACPNGNSDYGGASKSRSTSTGNDSSGNTCFKCGQTGHWSSKCPQGNTTGSKRGRGRGSGGASRAKRGRGTGKKKFSAFAAADEW